MNAIMGMTTLAGANLDDRERVEDCLKKIAFSSKHLLSLINDILDMSKIERAKITLSREKVVLPELVEQLSAMLTAPAEEAGLSLESSLVGIQHPCFYGDALRINQILINILGNAVKFTPEGGRVVLTAEEMLPLQGEGYARYCFTIRDTGIGMSEEFLAHLFEPFTRNQNTARVEGTGLGLSITKGLVELMGGKLSVESRVHQGTAFHVELEFETALQEERSDRRDTALPESQSLAGRRFLVAEDNAINSEILCEMLQMFGAGSVVKEDGLQALRAFDESVPGTYDAILMDIRMPEMNGYEAARAIRAMERPDAGTIPIVAMTGNAFDEDVHKSIEAGMNAHVAKPIDVETLRGTLGRLLNGSE